MTTGHIIQEWTGSAVCPEIPVDSVSKVDHFCVTFNPSLSSFHLLISEDVWVCSLFSPIAMFLAHFLESRSTVIAGKVQEPRIPRHKKQEKGLQGFLRRFGVDSAESV